MLDHADYMAPIGQRGLFNTKYFEVDRTYQGSICAEKSTVDRAEIDY